MESDYQLHPRVEIGRNYFLLGETCFIGTLVEIRLGYLVLEPYAVVADTGAPIWRLLLDGPKTRFSAGRCPGHLSVSTVSHQAQRWDWDVP